MLENWEIHTTVENANQSAPVQVIVISVVRCKEKIRREDEAEGEEEQREAKNDLRMTKRKEKR